MRKLDYEVLSDAELEHVLERSTAKYEAGPDTRRAGERARLLHRLIPIPRFFTTRSEADAHHVSEGLLRALVLATAVTGILYAALDVSRWVVASVWLATLLGVAMRYRHRASEPAQRAAGVRRHGA